MLIFFSILAILLIAGLFYLQQPIFGKAPEGKRLERIRQWGFDEDLQGLRLAQASLERGNREPL